MKDERVKEGTEHRKVITETPGSGSWTARVKCKIYTFTYFKKYFIGHLKELKSFQFSINGL